MAIFYMDVKIIGRSSGRTATGAAAYRRSAKMQSVAHAAYQRGEKIIEKGEKITHDYRSKGGVVHSEIILPEGAPPEFMDAQTLWNTVEASETRKNAQLAREIIVALPHEFNLEEHIEVLRAYSQKNFVKIGICIDFSIHDKGDNNPHAHIMLTMRKISQAGFEKKNRNWNKKELLLEWRKAWANAVNDMFECKGLTERIDHRSYKEQGIDRLPYIHMGHEATTLEKKGIHTRRGDYNREIQRHNEELAAKETRTALIDASFKMRQEEQEYKGLAGLDVERYSLRIKCDSEEREIIKLKFRAEDADERVKAIDKLQDKGEKLTAERQKMHFWQIRRKRDIDWEIRKIEQKIRDAQRSFEIEHNITYDKAPTEIERIKKELDAKRSGLEKKKARIAEITKIYDDIEENHRTQMHQLALEVDWNLVEEILIQMREPPPPPKPQDPYDISKLVQLAQKLDVAAVPEKEFKKILDGLNKIQMKLNKTKRRSRPR